jgi:hypothetical protein
VQGTPFCAGIYMASPMKVSKVPEGKLWFLDLVATCPIHSIKGADPSKLST